MWDLLMQTATATGIIVLFIYVVIPLLSLIGDLAIKLFRKLTGKKENKEHEDTLKDVYLESMHWMNSGGKK